MITSLAQFREYIKNRYGGGVGGAINVELGVEQLNQSIEDAVQTFQRYNYGEGLYEDFMVLSLVPGVSAYTTSGANIEDVVGFSMSNGSSNSINQLFTPANLLLGGSFNVFNNGEGLSLTNYTIAQLFLRTIEDIFSVSYRVDYRELQQLLIITPTPAIPMIGIIKVYRKESAINLYNHLLVKKLAVAFSKQVWGTELSKYGSMTLPGGGTYGDFGNKIWEQGITEVEKLEDRMNNEGEPPGFTIG